jgi:hypothetical protein
LPHGIVTLPGNAVIFKLDVVWILSWDTCEMKASLMLKYL